MSSILTVELLEDLYARYNRRCYVSPDPLQFVLEYARPGDREVVGMIASSLAFGNVKQVLRSVSAVLDRLPEPQETLMAAHRPWLERTFEQFRHRYVTGRELVELLWGVRSAIEGHGSLEACFARLTCPGDETVVPALSRFVGVLRANDPSSRNYLLPSPDDGSACKRLNLFLRWMVRHDEVDPGGWRAVRPSQLVVPLDTHMHRIAVACELTRRKQADLKAALEVTRAFRALAPEDPARYDFTLTRFGIRKEADNLPPALRTALGAAS